MTGNENNRNRFFDDLKASLTNKEPRILEVYRENEKLYISKFDYIFYTGKNDQSDKKIVEVSQELINRICDEHMLTPEYYLLKTKEREESIDYYRKAIESVFRIPYEKKEISEDDEREM